MTREVLVDKYFDWMCSVVCEGKRSKRITHKKLLRYLHNVEFTCIMEMDDNRAGDGVELRYRFAYQHMYPYAMIDEYFDDKPCSILEMMTALVIRIVENIMDDPDESAPTGYWFWNMIDSLGLANLSDSVWNEDYADEIINRFLNREYEPNGEGGLFTVNHCKKDMRDVEIWYQMCWYLDDILNKRERRM